MLVRGDLNRIQYTCGLCQVNLLAAPPTDCSWSFNMDSYDLTRQVQAGRGIHLTAVKMPSCHAMKALQHRGAATAGTQSVSREAKAFMHPYYLGTLSPRQDGPAIALHQLYHQRSWRPIVESDDNLVQ